ncbi:MAG: PAS domain-containing protein [Nostoc sp.]
MHIKEPTINSLSTQLSVQDSQILEPAPLHKQQKNLPQENSNTWQCSLAAVEMALIASGLGLWDWNLVTDKTYYDPQWKRILGYELDEIAHELKSFEQLVHPQDLPIIRQVLQNYLQEYRPVFEVELRMLTKSGEWKWILTCGKVFQWDEFGRPFIPKNISVLLICMPSLQLIKIYEFNCFVSNSEVAHPSNRSQNISLV